MIPQKRNPFPPSTAMRDAFERASGRNPGVTRLHRMVHSALTGRRRALSARRGTR